MNSLYVYGLSMLDLTYSETLEKELSERQREEGGWEKEDKRSYNVSLYGFECLYMHEAIGTTG